MLLDFDYEGVSHDGVGRVNIGYAAVADGIAHFLDLQQKPKN